jgi:uncharacterized protein YbjT (DUF2867 family)
VLQGSLDDESFVTEATRGADVLFWLTPPPWVDNFQEAQVAIGRVGAAAAGANRIPRVVHLSSIGAHQERGTGPVAGLHEIETLFDEAVDTIAHLRPAYFMENFLAHAGSIAEAGSIFLPIEADAKLPMVATRDIGEVAARWVLDAGWSGRHHVGIHGPADLSHAEAAAAISAGLGRQISYVQVPFEATREAMVGMGIPGGTVDVLLELYDGINKGRLAAAEPRTDETTTPTSVEQWAREVMRPAMQ